MFEDTPNILIVDDEAIARQRIKRFIKESGRDAALREAQNGLEALTMIQDCRPDLLFLDIEMPGLTGFEFLQLIQDRSFPVIFQTAYDEFALKAFEENACDYLLKPFSEERFRKALDRGFARRSESKKNLDGLATTLLGGARYIKNITAKAGRDLVVLAVNEVNYLTSQDHVTCLYAHGREYISDLSLDRLEEILDPREFVRVHRNSTIRISAVKRLARGADSQVELICGTTLSVSRRRLTDLADKLKALGCLS